ncbi:Uncharacterized protein PBTT_09432 [Plasmodiophora brassicae]
MMKCVHVGVLIVLVITLVVIIQAKPSVGHEEASNSLQRRTRNLSLKASRRQSTRKLRKRARGPYHRPTAQPTERNHHRNYQALILRVGAEIEDIRIRMERRYRALRPDQERRRAEMTIEQHVRRVRGEYDHVIRTFMLDKIPFLSSLMAARRDVAATSEAMAVRACSFIPYLDQAEHNIHGVSNAQHELEKLANRINPDCAFVPPPKQYKLALRMLETVKLFERDFMKSVQGIEREQLSYSSFPQYRSRPLSLWSSGLTSPPSRRDFSRYRQRSMAQLSQDCAGSKRSIS